VIPAIALRYGGPSRAIYEMCRALQSQGCETLIATTDADGQGRLPVELGKALSYNDVPTIFFRRQWSEALKYSQPLARWLDQNVKSFDAVHIHAVFSHACLAASKACRKHNVPYVVRPLGTLDPWSMGQKPLRKQLMWRFAAARMLRDAAVVHYTTLEERTLAESSLGIGRGVVIPLGIETDKLQDRAYEGIFRQRYPSLGDDPYVLSMSRIHPKKKLELLLGVFLSLIEQPRFRNWHLVIAGDGDPEYVASLQRFSQEKGGNGSVIFAGWLDGAQKVSALQGAGLLALASRQENFGICAVEALACGVPVLVSKQVNLAAEIEKARAGWVTDLEQEDLTGVLASALNDEEDRRRRGKSGRDFAMRQFSWPELATKLAELYHSIVQTNAVGLSLDRGLP